MKTTGKVLSTEQLSVVTSAANTPLVAIHCGPRKSAQQLVHQFALEAGLPEITGFYGADLDSGEILAP